MCTVEGERIILGVVNELPDVQRDVILHRYWNGMEYNDIASILKLNSYSDAVHAEKSALRILRKNKIVLQLGASYGFGGSWNPYWSTYAAWKNNRASVVEIGAEGHLIEHNLRTYVLNS